MTTQDHDLRKLIAKMEPLVRRAFLNAIARAVSHIEERELAALIAAGRIDEAVQLLRIDQSHLWPLQEVIRNSMLSGGKLAEAVVNQGLRGVFSFNGRHQRAEAWLAHNGAQLIEGITNQSEASVRSVLVQGLQEGRSSRSVALEITGRKVGRQRVGGILGLTSAQTDHVLSARAMLLDPARIREYFVRDQKTGRWKPRFKLSDRRFDRMIRKAIDNGTALAAADVDRVIEAHKSKALGYRGRVIAKHEARTAIAIGREEGFQQALERPDVETVTVRWQHNLSKEPREEHVAMNGTVIQLGESFEFPDGTRMKHPHDETAPARHRIGCNCMAMYRVRFRRG